MKETTKVYLIAFLILAVLAFVLSSTIASIFVIDNSNAKKLTAIQDDSVIIPKTENTTRHTNNTTTFTNLTNNIIEVADDAWNNLIR